MRDADDLTDAVQLDPAAAALRASDADRERTATLLREHTGAGRLTPEELEERLDAAYAARTAGELQTLVADLPALPPAPRRRPPGREQAHRRLLHATGLAVLVSAACVALWLATGTAGSFWPKWIILASAIRLAFVAWSELGPSAGDSEARLGRGGVPPRELPRPTDRDR